MVDIFILGLVAVFAININVMTRPAGESIRIAMGATRSMLYLKVIRRQQPKPSGYLPFWVLEI
jgi:hypothetical protein